MHDQQRCIALSESGNGAVQRYLDVRGRQRLEKKMKSTLTRVLLTTAFVAVGLNSAFAQGSLDHVGRQPSYRSIQLDGPDGSQRGTGYGQGGSAGTHSTGANVGPGRAEMDHATGP